MALFQITQGEFAGAEIRTTSENPRRVSVYDVVQAITGNVNPRQKFAELRKTFPTDVRILDNYKFPGRRQRDTPVTDARGLVIIMNLLQGERAARFRLKEADVLVRHLGGDLSLIQEIRDMRALQESLPDDHPARIFGEDVEARAAKRSLEDDPAVYEAKKQRLLAEIEAEKQKSLALIEVDRRRIEADMVVAHAAFARRMTDDLTATAMAPATQQIVLQMRHTLTAQLASMTETVAGGVPALPAPAQGLSALAQAQRITVQMFASQAGVPAARQTEKAMGDLGRAAAHIWAIERRLGQVEQCADGGWVLVRYTGGSMRERGGKVVAPWVPEWTDEVFATKRIKYSGAYRGGMEQTATAPRDTWTYPRTLGTEVLTAALARMPVEGSPAVQASDA